MRLEHLVCDVNGTLATDGRLAEGVSRALNVLRDRLEIHLLTADTFGRQALIDRQLNMTAARLESSPVVAEAGGSEVGGSEVGGSEAGYETRQKLAYIERLGAERVVAIGQGANDAQMLRAAGIGICVHSAEGTAIETLLSADLVVPSILLALELLEKPLRLVATLRK